MRTFCGNSGKWYVGLDSYKVEGYNACQQIKLSCQREGGAAYLRYTGCVNLLIGAVPLVFLVLDW